MSFNIDEWKARFSSCKDAETRCQMLRADGLILSGLVGNDSGFRRWLLDNRVEGDSHELALYGYKNRISNDSDIIRYFRSPIRQTQIAIMEPLSRSSVMTGLMKQLAKLYIEHYYVSCAVGVERYKGIQSMIESKIQKLQHEICLFKGNNNYQSLLPLYKDLRTKINMLVTKLVDEIITTDHWSCQLVIELVMCVI
jgi:hypothetical protein